MVTSVQVAQSPQRALDGLLGWIAWPRVDQPGDARQRLLARGGPQAIAMSQRGGVQKSKNTSLTKETQQCRR